MGVIKDNVYVDKKTILQDVALIIYVFSPNLHTLLYVVKVNSYLSGAHTHKQFPLGLNNSICCISV